MPTHYPYKHRFNKAGSEIKSHTYRALRQSKLKEMHIVRYADDFKIFCRSHSDAVKTFKAVSLWLKERLGLEISHEKSKVINLKQRYSEFLGFKLKVGKKGNKFAVRSHMSDKSKQKAKEKIADCIKAVKHPKNDKMQFKAIQHIIQQLPGCTITTVLQQMSVWTLPKSLSQARKALTAD